jgi:hypothetical protein
MDTLLAIAVLLVFVFAVDWYVRRRALSQRNQ